MKAGNTYLVSIEVGYMNSDCTTLLVSNAFPEHPNNCICYEYITLPSSLELKQWIEDSVLPVPFTYNKNITNTFLPQSPTLDLRVGSDLSKLVAIPNKREEEHQSFEFLLEVIRQYAYYNNVTADKIVRYDDDQYYMEYTPTSSFHPSQSFQTEIPINGQWNCLIQDNLCLTNMHLDILFKLSTTTTTTSNDNPLSIISMSTIHNIFPPTVLHIHVPLTSLLENIQWIEPNEIHTASDETKFYTRNNSSKSWSLLVSNVTEMLPRTGHKLAYQTTWYAPTF